MSDWDDESVDFALGEVIEFEYHPEGCSPIIIDTLDVGSFSNLGLLYDEFDELEEEGADVMASSRSPSGNAEKDSKKWLVEVKSTEKVEKPQVELKSKAELKEFVQGTKNVNTVRKTSQIVNAFQRWLSEFCMEERPIHTIDPEELDGFISNYLLNKKTVKGEEHQPDTLTGIHRGILRHLKERDYPVDPLQDDAFEMSRNVLASKRSTLKKAGLGNKPNRAECLDDDQIERMWKSGALGYSTPETLQDSVYFFLNIGFGLRGCHEARQMAWGDVELKQDEDESLYLEFNERASKTRTGAEGGHIRSFAPKVYQVSDETRCPVYYYKAFSAKRPLESMEAMAPFYLTVKPGSKMQDTTPYSKAPMGINKLREIVKRMSKTAGLDGKHTNHSLRKTTCQSLMAADVPPVLVAQLSGHKSLSSLNNYTTATRPQQKAMSAILTGSKRPSSSLGSPPKQAAIDEEYSASYPVALPVLPGNTHPGPVSSSQVIQRLAQSASGMFSGATINGSVSLNINYNVQSTSQANVQLSPALPKPNIEQ